MPQTLYINNSLTKQLRPAQIPAGYTGLNVKLATIHV